MNWLLVIGELVIGELVIGVSVNGELVIGELVIGYRLQRVACTMPFETCRCSSAFMVPNTFGTVPANAGETVTLETTLLFLFNIRIS